MTLGLRRNSRGGPGMRKPMRPAAYIRIVSRPGVQPPARQREAIIAVARDRGWPEPVVYADDGRATADGYGPALAKLSAAVGAGRHDMVIMPGPGVISRSPAHLMAFLFRCNHHGVAVEFISPAPADAFLMRPPHAPDHPRQPPDPPASGPPVPDWPRAAQLPPAGRRRPLCRRRCRNRRSPCRRSPCRRSPCRRRPGKCRPLATAGRRGTRASRRLAVPRRAGARSRARRAVRPGPPTC